MDDLTAWAMFYAAIAGIHEHPRNPKGADLKACANKADQMMVHYQIRKAACEKANDKAAGSERSYPQQVLWAAPLWPANLKAAQTAPTSNCSENSKLGKK